jgi:hypothetical protein
MATRIAKLCRFPLLAAVAVAALAMLGSTALGVSGAGFTTINSTADGGGVGKDQGLCHNGNGNVNCNQYFSKQFVWMNGGPDTNGLTDGKYFFAVLVPGMQHDPNDKVPVSTSDKNLSDDFDTYQNRTFTIKNGEIDTYAGTHSFGVDTADNNEKKIRLAPYSDTTNNGGVYILAVCSLAPDRKGNTYPVKPQACKYDAFKIRADHDKPECPSPKFGTNASGQKTAYQQFQDPGGIDLIRIDRVTNATIAPLKPGENWFQGTTSWIELTATKIDQSRYSSIQIFVRDVAGNEIRCDPVLTTLRGRVQRFRVSEQEDTVSIRNGRPGLKRLTVSVNGRRYVVKGLRPGQRAKLNIRAALRPGKRNQVTLVGTGRRGGSASIMIAN